MCHLNLNSGLAAILWDDGHSHHENEDSNIYLIPCQYVHLTLPFLLSDLYLIKKKPETKSLPEFYPIWLLYAPFLWWSAHKFTSVLLCFLIHEVNNEHGPNHPIMVLFQVPVTDTNLVIKPKSVGWRDVYLHTHWRVSQILPTTLRLRERSQLLLTKEDVMRIYPIRSITSSNKLKCKASM